MGPQQQSASTVRVLWQDRYKSVVDMPGGYGGYLDALRWVAENTREIAVDRSGLEARFAERFGLTHASAVSRVLFLKRVGFLDIQSGVCRLPNFIESWLQDRDPSPLIVRLHNRVQFIGEMLAMLESPRSIAELLRLARERYRMTWKGPSQVEWRKGWLQSAELTRFDSDNRLLYRTNAGTAFLDLVMVEPPLGQTSVVPSRPPADASTASLGPGRCLPLGDRSDSGGKQAARPVGSVAELADRIVAASTNTSNPAQFESVVCEAFDFLGFEAEHLGGSGKTDVLLNARLGLDASYRVTIDAKTTSSPALQDQQVDWVTLSEHRAKHEADYSMLVGPNPSTRRLLDRAQDQGVAVLSSDALADLVRRHAARPLGLTDYRSMFQSGGTVDLPRIKEKSNEAEGLATLAKRLLAAIGEEAEHLGPRTARDLHGRLFRDEGAAVAAEPQIQDLLYTLASPLVGAIQGDADDGYVLACSPAVTAARLRALAEALSDG